MLNEHEVLSDFLKLAEQALVPRGAVVFRHVDVEAGKPDVSITNQRKTVWLEFKVADNSHIHGTQLQAMTCRRLSRAGYCWYVVYEEHGAYIDIVSPVDVLRNGFITVVQKRLPSVSSLLLWVTNELS